MEHFRYHAKPDGNELRVYPFVCWHIGCEQSDERFIKEMISRVKNDPDARWIMLGDLGDVVTRHSKGEIFTQRLSPEEQMDRIVDLCQPIATQCLFGVKGNHGDRVYRETGMSFDKTLCHRLNIPYMGNAAFGVLKVHNTEYHLYVRHGLSSGATTGSKVKKAEDAAAFVSADAVITAHSHIATELDPQYIAYIAHAHSQIPIKWRTMHQYVCGSAYDSRSGYGEAKGYKPLLPAHVCIAFRGWRKRGNEDEPRQQTFTVYRTNPNG